MALWNEDVEDGNLSEFSIGSQFSGGGTASVDSGSQVSGTYSMLSQMSAEGEAPYTHDIGASGISEIYYQFKFKIPTGHSLGIGDTFGIFALRDTADTNGWGIDVVNNNEGGGVYSTWIFDTGIPGGGEDPGIDFVVGNTYRVEVAVKISATVGRVRVWVDNDTEGSPDYDTGSVNTGTNNVRYVKGGDPYSPASRGDLYFDDFIYDSSFIGAPAAAISSYKTLLGVGL